MRPKHCLIDKGSSMAYIADMEFEWDETKSEACLRERGFDFAYVLKAFVDPDRLVRKDHRWDYGEDRFQLMGVVEERVFVVIYTVRKRAVRIISARKANSREVTQYENNASES